MDIDLLLHPSVLRSLQEIPGLINQVNEIRSAIPGYGPDSERSRISMDMYWEHALEGATGVELTIALYDGIIRFMHNAIEAVERRDVEGRRAAVKRAMDIVVHLQATLKTDIGGTAAESLSEFYVALFALMLQGSQASSRQKFEHVIAGVCSVRDAWKQVAADFAANQFCDRRQADVPGTKDAGENSWIPQGEDPTAAGWRA